MANKKGSKKERPPLTPDRKEIQGLLCREKNPKGVRKLDRYVRYRVVASTRIGPVPLFDGELFIHRALTELPDQITLQFEPSKKETSHV